MMTQLSENCRKTAEIYGDLIKQLDDRIQKSNEPLKSSGEKTKLGTGGTPFMTACLPCESKVMIAG